MKKKICIPASMAPSFQEFLDSEGITVELVSDEQCDVEVIQCNDRKESNLDTIYSGGWVVCETARALAKKLAIPVRQMGKLLDCLDVKIRNCSLGCFK